MLTDFRTFLLVNPWIYDFAAYDFWAKPLGLLYIASLLRREGKTVFFFDCTDPNNPYSELPRVKKKPDGRGKYHSFEVDKPEPLKSIPRRYKRYGVEVDAFRRFLSEFSEPPDMVFITTRMTYWYPGVLKAVEVIEEFFPKVRVLVGGIYPTLCPEHAAAMLGENRIYTSYDLSPLFGKKLSFSLFPMPSFDLYEKLDYIVFMTGVGCPFRCSYCATPVLYGSVERKNPELCLKELEYIVSLTGEKKVAIYDDALLFKSEEHAKPLFRSIVEAGLEVKFYNPNGLHAKFIDLELAHLLNLLFDKVFIGLESLSYGNGFHEKVTKEEFERALSFLFDGGFTKERIGVYLLVGFPGQSFKEALRDVEYVKSLGLRPSLSEFSPIPGTPMFSKARKLSRYPLDEPLFHNNSVFPMENPRFTREELNWLKIYARSQ